MPGGGCCAATAEKAICAELASWPTIVSVTGDPQTEADLVILVLKMEDPFADAVEAT